MLNMKTPGLMLKLVYSIFIFRLIMTNHAQSPSAMMQEACADHKSIASHPQSTHNTTGCKTRFGI
jgi:hypothetical protein